MTTNETLGADREYPIRVDFVRAAALLAHFARAEVTGVADIVGRASADSRLTALVIAIIDTATAEHGNQIATTQGRARLQEFALELAAADFEEHEDHQRAHVQDFRRAAVLYLHRMRNDSTGVKVILEEAEEAGRAWGLIVAAAALAYLAPGSTLSKPDALAGLEQVASSIDPYWTPDE